MSKPPDVTITRSMDASREMGLLEPRIRAEYQKMYGDSDEAGDVDPAWFTEPSGGLIVARFEDALIGCAGWVRLEVLGYDRLPNGWNPHTYAEVKRLWVDPDWRGRGLSISLDAVRAAQAKRQGIEFLVGETGEEQTVSAKAHLTSMGYSKVAPFGRWADNPGSTFFGKRL